MIFNPFDSAIGFNNKKRAGFPLTEDLRDEWQEELRQSCKIYFPEEEVVFSEGESDSLVDHLKKKKGLYEKVKRAYLDKVSDEIEKNNKNNIDFEEFIFELLEGGVKNN